MADWYEGLRKLARLLDGSGKLAQVSSHESPDTDTGTGSLHHTLGAGANQAAAGDHTHGASGLTEGQVGARVELGG